MREVERVPADTGGGTLHGRFGLRAPRRRRAVVVAVLALLAACGAVAAVAGPGMTMRPASSAGRSVETGGSAGPTAPASTAGALALAVATADPTAGPASGATPAAGPSAAPTPPGHAPTASPAPVPCNAAGTSGDTVRPCPPPPCRYAETASPSGAMAPNPCPPPPPCAHPAGTPSGPAMWACPPRPCMEPMAAAPTPAMPVRDCPPPPCRWTAAGSDAVVTGPCPPPCNAAAVAPSSPAAAPNYVRACPPPPWSGMVVLTERDAGRTITVHAGTRILVRLASGGGVWTEPVTSDGAVVTRVSSSHDSEGDAWGDFRAATAGNANLTATDSPRCAPQCKVMSRLWIVHIVVVA